MPMDEFYLFHSQPMQTKPLHLFGGGRTRTGRQKYLTSALLHHSTHPLCSAVGVEGGRQLPAWPREITHPSNCSGQTFISLYCTLNFYWTQHVTRSKSFTQFMSALFVILREREVDVEFNTIIWKKKNTATRWKNKGKFKSKRIFIVCSLKVCCAPECGALCVCVKFSVTFHACTSDGDLDCDRLHTHKKNIT